ncbi:hypothetical protein NVV94_14735 [Pseudomonas sp. LS1212]|uniref:hypothetical protein n=1 Tax=Pseudomonas sp. LS1212 TaxID=2972478 RepID=UPI00215C939A|nr:hypothetical protein [Pseudomonas sp. LS1212]UVJ41950.1 hypothetical protein NVV94_14735 [Pseudomonas sp. LS1212]
MNLVKLFLIGVVAIGSTSAMAEDGIERSQAYWKEFRANQEKIHGKPDQPKTSEVAKKKTESSNQLAEEQKPKN